MNKVSDFSAEDISAIERTARDYAEGWYEGDADRMRRALHPRLVKRTIAANPFTGEYDIREPDTNADQMVRWTSEGVGATWEGERDYDVQVLDIFRDIAVVRCQSPEYVDYLQVARCGSNGWRIMNVLWQLRSGECDVRGDAAGKWSFWKKEN